MNVFSARADSVRPLAILFKGISVKDSLRNCYCMVNAEGLRFITHESNTLQLTAYLKKDLFREYNFKDEVSFGIDLHTLLECITIFGNVSNSSSNNVWGGKTQTIRIQFPIDDALALTIEENGVITDCKIKTQEAPEFFSLNESLTETPFLAKLIINSSWLKSAFSELDGTAERFTVLVSPNAPYFRISVKSVVGDAQIDYPKDTDVFETFTCDEVCSNSYKYSTMLFALRALQVSTKTYIRINQRGFLSMQFMVPVTDSQVSFIDFIIVPLLNDEE
ncbi:ssDNA endodeoxyribonuclease [Nowakowskiella sp. JEL0407]|nr:ssDNA endodeoxyribonuclease [Nowakowskiella sp. JEL0407]